jgi:NADPH-dependent curcumin reductase CurA
MTARVNRQWRLVARPVSNFKDSDFEWREEPVPAIGEGQILVRNLYLSLDPTNRIWATEADSYLPPVPLGDVMRGGGIGVVEESQNANFPVGTNVSGMIGWQDYLVTDGSGLNALPNMPGVPLTVFLGLFSHIGLTAYFGLLDVGQPKEGETLVVSGAAGATGSLVGQIGKIKGCRVVGIAGSDDKCKWLVDELGYDAAINYKTENVRDSLKKHCPNGIDGYFENVGGEILDAVLAQINNKARIALCGLISQYNATEPVPGPYNFANLISKRARVEGFIVLDYMSRAQECFSDLGKWLMEGKLKYRVDEVEGLENTVTGINKLFTGGNSGKLVVKIA